MTTPTGPGLDLPNGFLMGASTSAHQVEGNNVSSDWWGIEQRPGTFVAEPSGDAADSFHRWPEDMDLLRELGFNAYRFGIEWARIEPERGQISRAAVAHYRAMVEGALERGLTPVVTLHHFTSPRWFSEGGGWLAPDSAELFAAFARTAVEILQPGVRYVVTINEPNMLAVMHAIREVAAQHGWESIAHGKQKDAPTGAAAIDPASIEPDAAVAEALIRAHRAASAVLRSAAPGLRVGWTIANQVYQAEPGAQEVADAHAWLREDIFLEASRQDDWIGVQAYTRHRIGKEGPLPVPDDAETTLTGWEYYPQALGEAVRHTAEVVGPQVPVLVTENGIATADDRRRIDYTTRALASLAEAMRDGIEVLGYLHWSALDNYEWGTYRPTFGLIAVDRETFVRTPKESARRLGALARSGRIPEGAELPEAGAVSSR
ncbi:glycoside hydrolase family 1 protein [Streptomyces triticagri]|uniref:Glycoside hydrolase family 1 protein n=1 Tax=Streptomyces triticagri TaxID=2293568 RepID=A0A372LWB8_9ACTN|nr:family 1 glycosylhydrolase [Streptomyces triticagri]RFU82585.1 glycoside hydrolase family 1 protein [Streptomyces triticagri]